MSSTDVALTQLDPHRSVVTGLTLPSPPPARIYVSGHMYKIAAPQVSLPAVVNGVKIVLNWLGPASAIARNILHVIKSSGSGSTSDPAQLATYANDVMAAFTTAGITGSVVSNWSLQSVRVSDLGGSSAAGTSTSAPQAGAVSGTPYPPQVAVVASWRIAASYRGGKPRTYMPGIPTTAASNPGESKLNAAYATGVDTAWTNFLNLMNLTHIGGDLCTMGAISYYTGHAVRPSPVFQAFTSVTIHERLDSQRRRNGKESLFPQTP